MSNFAKETVSIILGGGAGSRLSPLTASRSKPAVPIAGKYRLVDIPISNCINSNLNRIFVYYVARLIVMSFCALCYFIVVDTLIHFLNVLHCSASRLVKFACDNPPLFSKCKNR